MVNQVRKRAGLADLATNLTQDQLRENIRHERRVETPFELIRYYDMKRWKIMDKLNGLELDPLLSGHVTAWSKAHEYESPSFINGVRYLTIAFFKSLLGNDSNSPPGH